MATKKLRKKQKLRNNEYYNTQKTYDILYEKSKENSSFKKLYEIITSEENILLAYRNIKRNKGSKTKGTNKTTIIDMQMTLNCFAKTEKQQKLCLRQQNNGYGID